MKKVFLFLFSLLLVFMMPFVNVYATEGEENAFEVPDVPEVPEVPDVPEVPEVPEVPTEPETETEPEEEQEEEKHEHNYTYSIKVVEATCKEEGYTEYICSCGESYKNNVVEKLPHKESLIEGQDPTCTREGFTVGLVCSVCDEIIVEPTPIPIVGHTIEEYTIILEATEEKEGIRKGVCKICGADYTEKYKLEVEEKDPIEDEPKYPCQVVIKDSDYGDIIVDVEYGNIGDIVTIYAKPYSFCKLVSLNVNGVDLIPNEDGNFQFPLVEGENIIVSKFEIDSEQFEKVAQLLADAKDGNWENIFNIENVFQLISALVTLFMGSGYCVTLLKSKKIKSETTTEVATGVKEVLDSNVYKAIKDFLQNTFGPTFDKLSGNITNIEEVVKTMARCMVLSQENTPESRLAIIEELTKLQKSDEELSAQVKAIIQKEIESNEAIQKQKMDTIKELQEANSKIAEEAHESPEVEQTTDNSEGRY